MLSDTPIVFAGRSGAAIDSCRSMTSASGGIGSHALCRNVRASAGDTRSARAARLPCSSPSDTPEYPGCRIEPWPSTSTMSASARGSNRHRLGGAGDEVGDHRVDAEAPALDEDSRLSGRRERRAHAARGAARRAAEASPSSCRCSRRCRRRERSVASSSRTRPVPTGRLVGRLSDVVNRARPASRQADASSGSLADEAVQAVPDLQAVIDARARVGAQVVRQAVARTSRCRRGARRRRSAIPSSTTVDDGNVAAEAEHVVGLACRRAGCRGRRRRGLPSSE